jgi:hypothetical protein
VFGLRILVAAGAVATLLIGTVASTWAGADGPANPSYLLFAGTDLWREGAFVYGGLLWSPAGLGAEGFTLKLLLNGGGYTYPSGGLHLDVDGRQLSASALPGWRMTRDGLTVTVFAGPTVQDYRLTPYDPGGRLHGLYGGGQLATDIWYQPNATTMLALNGSVASIGPSGSLRVAIGERLLPPAFVGPEAQAFWCADYSELRVGAHVTGWPIDALQWDAGAGWGIDTDRRAGPYLRVGFNGRY